MLKPLAAGASLLRSARRSAASVLGASRTLLPILPGAGSRLRVSITPALVVGRAERVHVTVPGLRFGGLHLAALDVRARRVRLLPGWPPRMQADSVVARATVEQGALDEWTRSSGLPVRLALRPGGITARTGIGGFRLGELDMAVQIQGGHLRLVPQRMSMLGVAIAPGAAMAPVTLPLPVLPGDMRLVAVVPADGAIDVTVDVAKVDEPVTPARLSSGLDLLRHHGTPGHPAAARTNGSWSAGPRAPAAASPTSRRAIPLGWAGPPRGSPGTDLGEAREPS